jgi:hypothetical protein
MIGWLAVWTICQVMVKIINIPLLPPGICSFSSSAPPDRAAVCTKLPQFVLEPEQRQDSADQQLALKQEEKIEFRWLIQGL